MTVHIRRFRRFTTYFLLLAVASVLSLFGSKRADDATSEYSLIPPAPMAHADTPVDGGGSTLDTESTSCSSNGDGPACTDGGDGSGDGGDGSCGSGCAGGE